MRFAKDSPNPHPRVFVEYPGLNIREKQELSIPFPLSSISINILMQIEIKDQ